MCRRILSNSAQTEKAKAEVIWKLYTARNNDFFGVGTILNSITIGLKMSFLSLIIGTCYSEFLKNKNSGYVRRGMLRNIDRRHRDSDNGLML